MQMVESVGQKIDMATLKLGISKLYILLLAILEIAVKTQMSVQDNNHEFIQANSNEVRYMGMHDGLQVFMHKDIASSGVKISNLHEELIDEGAFTTSMYLKFVPPQLDFKDRHLGVPHLEKVMLVNNDCNKTIHMSSISGNTLHFHSSFFQDKLIPPKGNTTFAVVFLGRTEGQVSSHLYIHTSEGTFKYQVTGESIGSPYRLKPLGGIRIPLNAAFQPLIHLHNPHPYPIQVVEVYSSGSEFHLELPSGDLEGPKGMWEVPPFTTKAVIRARFHGMFNSNHTAYIRLKLNNSEEVLIVPVEVEVTSQPGLYSPSPFLDFGIAGSMDPPVYLKLKLCNSLKKVLGVQSISTSPPSKALSIQYQPTKVLPGSIPVEVAQLAFDWKKAYELNQTSGKIVIKSKHGQHKLVIPYTSTIYEGGAKLNETAIHFHSSTNHSPRHLSLINLFKLPIAINKLILYEEAARHFQITNFKPIIVEPGQSSPLFTIAVRDETVLNDLRVQSKLVVFTNFSDISVPVLSYNGRLKKVFPMGYNDVDTFDLGLVGVGSVKTVHFGLHNDNPVPVDIKSISTNIATIQAQLQGIYEGNLTDFVKYYNFNNLTNSTSVMPQGIAVLKLIINAPNSEEIISGRVIIKTQYEKFYTHIRATVAYGKLDVIPEEIIIDDCFPGKICSHQLKVQSTFNRPMTATGITSVPPDPRLSFSGGLRGSEILPSSSNYIGELRWEPSKLCGTNCYLGLPFNVTNGIQWMYNQILPSHAWDTDSSLIQSKYQKLINLTNSLSAGTWQHVLLRLDTNEVREKLFKAKIRLTWPKLANTSKLLFPLTQVTNTTIKRLKLFNPASQTIIVQLVMDWAYPQAKRLIETLPLNFRPHCGTECLNSAPKEFYIAQETDQQGKFTTTLAPGETYEVSISYSPKAPSTGSSLIFIRNNLTVMEVVELEGHAAFAQLKFGNRKPASENPLMFEIVEKHLKDCQKEKNKKNQVPNLTVKRSFTARNVGDLPIYINGFYINDLPCEGFGFSVLNCVPFELAVNGTKKVDIAFTPDFTLAKVQRTLTIDTSLGIEVNFTLITTLPPYLLSVCSSVVPRPNWEPLLYYSAVSFMLFLLFCILAASFFESDRIMKSNLLSMARERATITLDLKQVSSNVVKEFANQNKKMEIEQNEKKNKSSSSEERNNKYYNNATSLMAKFDETIEKEQVTNNQNAQSNGKGKKKLSKKNSNGMEGDTNEVSANNNKKKDKNGWCNVFSRTCATSEKMKGKQTSNENESNIKQIKNSIDMKREEKKQRIKKNKEDEETSSTTTDSSNDAEKENCRKTNKKNKPIENECEFQYEDMGEKNKSNSPKNGWKMNICKPTASKVEPIMVKGDNPELTKISEFHQKLKAGKNNARERKEKNGNKKKFVEKTSTQKGPLVENTNVNHRISPPINWWEHRSFSEVVARNDSPLYSNIVSTKSQPRQPMIMVGGSFFSEARKQSDSSTLGPIGSNKPSSTWSQVSNYHQIEPTPNNMLSLQDTASYIDQNEENHVVGLEDNLPLDNENLWEDQNAAMQMMYQRDSFGVPWKGNWNDHLWGTLQSAPGNGYQPGSSWSSLLNPSWGPSPWSPSTANNTDDDDLVFENYLTNHLFEYNQLSQTRPGHVVQHPPHIHSHQQQPPQQLPQQAQQTNRQHHIQDETPFSPFNDHSLSSIWSNNWSPPSNQ